MNVIGLEAIPKRKPIYRYNELSESYKLWLIDHYGYQPIWQNPFGSGGRRKWFVEVRKNENVEHAFFVRILEQLIRELADDVMVYEHSKPDIVFDCAKYGSVAVEVETGSRKQSRSELESRFKKLNKEYGLVLVFVTDKYLKRQYEKLAKTITRTEIKYEIASCFDAWKG